MPFTLRKQNKTVSGDDFGIAELGNNILAWIRAMVPINSSGNELFTASNPGKVSMDGSISATISTIAEVTNVPSVDLIDEVTNVTSVDTVDDVTEVANVSSVDLVDEVTEVANVTSVDLVDSVSGVGTVYNLTDSIDGPGKPSIDSYQNVSVSLSANTANQVLVAAQGANKQIWVYAILLVADTDAGTIALQDEDDTALTGAVAVSDEGGYAMQASGNFAMPLFKVATNKALEADTVTCSAAGFLTYAVVSV